MNKFFVVLCLTFLGFSLKNDCHSQVFKLGNTGFQYGWYKLGNLYLPQSGSDAKFRIVAGVGYNAVKEQLSECFIHFRTSNGDSQNGGFYGAGMFSNTGRAKVVSNIRVVQLSPSSWDFYALLPAFTGDGAFMTVETILGTWTSGIVNGLVLTGPPSTGIFNDLTEELAFLSPVYFDSNVGIGTTTPKEKLSVNGKIRATEIKVETANWPDYVFDDKYENRSLTELAAYIKEHKHLPEIPSAKEVEMNGIELGEMNKQLLKKVEELTLHVISQNEKIMKQELEQAELKRLILELSKEIKKDGKP
ncbi:hypothetical protein [Pedobacter cryoconitis]|uniref:Uncharacterized protein n=1 Tax=Pedobacter cryoconitis TaxID=188932 RepID=A0A7X0J9A9_9SPHI|nr:hypothetical protein [Pedobacter cryoconitis]MBB6502642.1 hypothetical protein [Pedobacter cryoconitis]